MVKQLKSSFSLLSVLIATLMLSACVTENYENDKSTPIVENDSSRNEIAMTRISLGLGYLNMGNTTQAKLNLEKAKRYSPDLAQVHTAFAHYYETVGEPELATASFETALGLSENDADTLNNYGVFLCRQGEYDAAEKQILKAIAVPSYLLVSQSYENLAMCQLKDNRFDKAELYLEKAILHNPSNANVYLQMVQLKYAKAEYKNAQLYLKRYEKATRRFSAQALALAFKVFEQQRQLGTARNYANMLVKMFPHSYEAKQYLLNGLDRIQADDLADEYKLSKASQGDSSSKKRVVVLSPNKSGNSQATLVSRNKTKPQIEKKQIIKAPIERTIIQPVKTPVASPKSAKNTAVSENTVVVKAQAKPDFNDEKVNKEAANKAYQALVKAQVTKVEEAGLAQNSAEKLPTTTHLDAEKNETLSQQQTENKVVGKHIVAKGESLFFISQKYNIKIIALKKWNNLDDSKVIKIGDTILLANPQKAQ